jgi:hypothetical protein
VKSQNVLLEQDVNKDTIIPKKGANRKYHTSIFIGAGSIFGKANADSSIPMQNFKSWEFRCGTVSKIRLTNWYSLVLNTSYSRQAFFLSPDSSDIRYNKMILNNVGLSVLNRFNYGKRGNSVGKYIEIGASVQHSFMVRQKFLIMNSDDNPTYKSTKYTLSSPNFINRLNYYADLRIGFKQYVLFGRYLLTDILDKQPTGQYPAITAGLMINLGAK